MKKLVIIFIISINTNCFAVEAPIFSAIGDTNVFKVCQIISADKSQINAKDDAGFTPLHRATSVEFQAIAKVLIESGADINAKSSKFGNIVQHAVGDSNVELVRLLVSNGVDLKSTGSDGLTVMHRLAWVNDPKVARILFSILYSQVPELVDDPGKCGVTPLYECVDRINAPVATILIANGADPAKAPDGPNSSAEAFLKKRVADEPALNEDLNVLSKAISRESEASKAEKNQSVSSAQSSLNELSNKAEKGDIYAQFELGMNYNSGTGVEVDKEKAFYWFQKVASNNTPLAPLVSAFLGDFYFYGTGVPVNKKEGMEWYRKAAVAGLSSGMVGVGQAYLLGEGTDKNPIEAIAWFEKAAAKGNGRAENQLGVIYEQGIGVDKDRKKAVNWLTKSALHGYTDAQAWLGWALYKGEAVPCSKQEGLAWLIIATSPNSQSYRMADIVKARQEMETEIGASGIDGAQRIAKEITTKYLKNSSDIFKEWGEVVMTQTAKNQCVSIATAITAYEVEYGRLPKFSGKNLSPENLSMLLSEDKINNPKGISFIEVYPWKHAKGGTNINGFCDPFDESRVYQVTMDIRNTNGITVPTNASGSMATITKHIGVWTILKTGETNVLINSWE